MKSISIRVFTIALLVLSSALALTGCASAPSIAENSINLDLLSKKQVTDKFGIDQKRDPFIAPTGLVRGKPYEFIVFKLTTSFMSDKFVKITIDARDNDGARTFGYWEKKDFIDMWHSWDSGEAAAVNREALIESYYVPGEQFTVRKGRNEWYLVLIGKNPLKHPLSLTIDVNAVGMAPYVKQFTIE